MSFISIGFTPATAQLAQTPGTRGPIHLSAGNAYFRAELPTDPLGICSIELTNLVPGSAVQVSNTAGSVVSTIASSSTLIVNAQVYSDNTLNILTVKVRKGSSAPFYVPYQTIVLASIGEQTIYISQTLDE